MSLIKKLSAKVILGGRPDIPPKGDKEPKWLFEIVGICTGKETGQSDYGEWTAMTGNFQATLLAGGAEFRTEMRCFMPAVVQGPVLAKLGMDGVTSVSFGYRVGVLRDDDAATGYVYTAEPLSEVVVADPLGELLSTIRQKRLDGPKGKSKAA